MSGARAGASSGLRSGLKIQDQRGDRQVGGGEQKGRSMTNKRIKQSIDRAWPQAMQWNLGFGAEGKGEMLWRCDAMRGGRVYTSGLFATEQEAQQFAAQLQQAEPDQTFNVEAIKASTVWN